MSNIISRTKYYQGVEKKLKETSNLPLWINVKEGDNDNPLWFYRDLFHEVTVPIDAHYEVKFVIGCRDFAIPEESFDKYHCSKGFMNYKDKSEVRYTVSDIDITVNNLKYLIMEVFRKNFLNG